MNSAVSTADRRRVVSSAPTPGTPRTRVRSASSYVEVLDAEQQLFPAENTLVATRLARLDALVALYKSLGGGWSLESRQASR